MLGSDNMHATLAHCKEGKYHIFGQYCYTRNVPVFTNSGTFQNLGPKVYFSNFLLSSIEEILKWKLQKFNLKKECIILMKIEWQDNLVFITKLH